MATPQQLLSSLFGSLSPNARVSLGLPAARVRQMQSVQGTPPEQQQAGSAALGSMAPDFDSGGIGPNVMSRPVPSFYGIGPPYTPSGEATGTPMTLPEGVMDPMGTSAQNFYRNQTGPNWRDYQGNPSTTGGFFSLANLFQQQGREVPGSMSSNAEGPSTNNWRLLPENWRSPGYVMRNGYIVNTDPGSPWYYTGFGGDLGGSVHYNIRSGNFGGLPAGMEGVGFWPGQAENPLRMV